MNVSSTVLSGLSLVAVIIIGWLSIRLGERAAKVAEESTRASERAAGATERSVVASERAALLASQDAKIRRIEALLDVVLEMRQLGDVKSLPWTRWVSSGFPDFETLEST